MSRSGRVKYDAKHPIGPQQNLNRLRRAQRIARHGRLEPMERNKFRYKLGKMVGRVIKFLING
jgi:hypothetical protein